MWFKRYAPTSIRAPTRVLIIDLITLQNNVILFIYSVIAPFLVIHCDIYVK